MRGLFVTGTDTGAGKSIVAAAICAALAERGERVAAFKPVVTGLSEPDADFPPDHELLARAAGGGQSPGDVAPYRYDPPLSPHLAAELAGETIEPHAPGRGGTCSERGCRRARRRGRRRPARADHAGLPDP